MTESITSFVADREYPLSIEMTGISYCDGSYQIYREKSDILVMEYIIHGTGTVEIDGIIFHPCAGDIYILPVGKKHTYFSDAQNPWTKIWFNVRGSLTDDLPRIYGIAGENHIRGLNLYPLFLKFLSIARQKSLPQEVIFAKNALVFHEIIQEIAAFLRKNDGISREACQLKEYIDRNLDKNISVGELAGLIFRSKSQTTRIFSSAFKITPYDYALNQKIETAKLLLKNTRLLVKEIAFRVGFSDEHYFSGLFRQKTGVSPKEYRE